jgi:hypothetical protein
MSDNNNAANRADQALEAFAAELAHAAYAIALRHGQGDSWINLELELWQVLTDTARKWRQELSAAGQ